MRIRTGRVILLAMLLGAPAALAGPPGNAPEASPSKRDPYRAPVLRSSIGAATSFEAAARGGRLVVVVMKGTWCDVCVGQLVRLAALASRLTRFDTHVIGLTTEAREKNRAVKLRYALPYDIVSDPNRLLVRDLGLWRRDWSHPIPSLLVFDRCGNEQLRIEGRTPADRPEPMLLELLRRLDAHPEQCVPPTMLSARSDAQRKNARRKNTRR